MVCFIVVLWVQGDGWNGVLNGFVVPGRDEVLSMVWTGRGRTLQEQLLRHDQRGYVCHLRSYVIVSCNVMLWYASLHLSYDILFWEGQGWILLTDWLINTLRKVQPSIDVRAESFYTLKMYYIAWWYDDSRAVRTLWHKWAVRRKKKDSGGISQNWFYHSNRSLNLKALLIAAIVFRSYLWMTEQIDVALS